MDACSRFSQGILLTFGMLMLTDISGSDPGMERSLPKYKDAEAGMDRPIGEYHKQKLKQRTAFLRDLLADYDPRVPPNFDEDSYQGDDDLKEDSTAVDVHLFISSFDSISETTMDYVLSIFLRQTWMDPRLDFSHLSNHSVVSLDARFIDNIWLPDLFFTNEKKAHFHDVTVPNRYIRIYQNGTIQYSARVSLALSCPMKLQKFPLDVQRCSMQMESYAYTTDKLYFKWRGSNPVEIHNELELPQFKLDGFLFKDCTKTYTTGSFTCLQVDFLLRRDIGFYMIQTYVPSALIVILSWVSFWINLDAVPARISLGVLTILTMTTQTTGVRQSLPRVSYVKSIDVWMASCLMFVFAALLEFAIVNVLCRKEVRRRFTIKRKAEHVALTNGDPAEQTDSEYVARRKGAGEFIPDPDGKNKARIVDKVARKLFPAAFLVFNGLYWCTYIFWLKNPSEVT